LVLNNIYYIYKENKINDKYYSNTERMIQVLKDINCTLNDYNLSKIINQITNDLNNCLSNIGETNYKLFINIINNVKANNINYIDNNNYKITSTNINNKIFKLFIEVEEIKLNTIIKNHSLSFLLEWLITDIKKIHQVFFNNYNFVEQNILKIYN